jgi:RIO kinase 2
MKLDVTCMRYLTKDDYRMLTAVEMGMRNHELVPVELICSIAKLRHGGSHKIMSTLLRYKLLSHENQSFDGYRLTYQGYDILALKTLLQRNVIASVGAQIGVGKESDIFEAKDEHDNDLVIKIHRLGRTSFRAVRNKRDYMAGKSKSNWLYMSRLAALKEFAFMQALFAHGFPTPVPIDHNRHIVAMSKVHGFPMAQIKSGNMEGAETVFQASLDILRRLAQCGLVHCDFNEFNLMVNPEDGSVTLIDFPQMVSTNHHNAAELFARDLGGLVKFFAMKMKFIPCDEDVSLKLEDIPIVEANIDLEVQAAGFTAEHGHALEGFLTTEGTHGTEERGYESEEAAYGEAEEGESSVHEDEDDGVGATVFGAVTAAAGEQEDVDDGVSDLGSDDGFDESAEDAFVVGHKKAVLLTGEELAKAREDARFRFNKGRGGPKKGSGIKGRNQAKLTTKYGKKTHKEKIEY